MNVLLVVANSASMAADDTELQTILEGRGHTVNVVSDETAEDVTGIDFVVIASSSDETSIGAKYSTITQPMWIDDRFVAADKLMYSGGNGQVAAAIDVVSAQNGHTALGGLNSSANPITIATAGNIGVITGTAASGAVVLAEDSGNNGPAYMYIPEGAALTSGNSPNLRVFFEAITSTTLGNFNASGDSLIDGLLDLIEAEVAPTTVLLPIFNRRTNTLVRL